MIYHLGNEYIIENKDIWPSSEITTSYIFIN